MRHKTLQKNNLSIREALKRHDMCQWELAELLGVTEVTITRWFRHELPEQRQREIVEIIENGGMTNISSKNYEN